MNGLFWKACLRLKQKRSQICSAECWHCRWFSCVCECRELTIPDELNLAPGNHSCFDNSSLTSFGCNPIFVGVFFYGRRSDHPCHHSDNQEKKSFSSQDPENQENQERKSKSWAGDCDKVPAGWAPEWQRVGWICGEYFLFSSLSFKTWQQWLDRGEWCHIWTSSQFVCGRKWGGATILNISLHYCRSVLVYLNFWIMWGKTGSLWIPHGLLNGFFEHLSTKSILVHFGFVLAHLATNGAKGPYRRWSYLQS